MGSNDSSAKIFAERVLIVIGLTVAAFLLLLLVYFTFDVILLVFAAVLLAIFLRGLADLLGYVIDASETWRVVIVSTIVVAVLAGSIALLAPSVAEQVAHLRDQLPGSAKAAADYISQYGWGKALIDQLPSFDDVRRNVGTSTLLTSVGGV